MLKIPSISPIVLGAGLLTGLMSLGVLFLHPDPAYALVPPMILPAFVLLFSHPAAGYSLMLILVPLGLWSTLAEGTGFSLVKLIGAGLVCVLLLNLVKNPGVFGKRLSSGLWCPLLVYFGLQCLSQLVSVDPLFSLDETRRTLTDLLTFSLPLAFFDRKKHLTHVAVVIAASSSFSALLGILGDLFHLSPFTVDVSSSYMSERAVGAAGDPNFYALILLVGLPLTVHFCFHSENRARKLFWALLALSNVYGIFLAFSRSATLLLGVLLLMLIAEHIGRVKIRHLGIVALVCCGLAAFALYAATATGLWQRMATLSRPSEDGSLLRRASYVKVSWEAIRQRPLLGSGPATFALAYAKSEYAPLFAGSAADYYRAAHNTYLEILVGQGVAGLAAFVWILATAMYYLYRAQKIHQPVDAARAGLVRAVGYAFAILLMNLVFLSDPHHKYIWILLGLTAVLYKSAKQEGETS